MRRKALMLVAVFVMLAITVVPALAVTDGELDGEGHPYVGLMVAQDADGNPLWRCSGTLMSPTVFLTAGHCTEAPAAHVEIWFDADVESGIPANGYPFTGDVGGTPNTHPDYNPNAFFIRDVGVVVLEVPYTDTKGEFGALPTPNQLDVMKTRRGRQDTTFTAVGFGLQRINPVFVEDRAGADVCDPAADPDQWRDCRELLAASLEQPLDRRHLLRRLGRPELHRDLERGRRSDFLRIERQLRRHRWCIPDGPILVAGLGGLVPRLRLLAIDPSNIEGPPARAALLAPPTGSVVRTAPDTCVVAVTALERLGAASMLQSSRLRSGSSQMEGA